MILELVFIGYCVRLFSKIMIENPHIISMWTGFEKIIYFEKIGRITSRNGGYPADFYRYNIIFKT